MIFAGASQASGGPCGEFFFLEKSLQAETELTKLVIPGSSETELNQIEADLENSTPRNFVPVPFR